jgi:hypothetical protein
MWLWDQSFSIARGIQKEKSKFFQSHLKVITAVFIVAIKLNVAQLELTGMEV